MFLMTRRRQQRKPGGLARIRNRLWLQHLLQQTHLLLTQYVKGRYAVRKHLVTFMQASAFTFKRYNFIKTRNKRYLSRFYETYLVVQKRSYAVRRPQIKKYAVRKGRVGFHPHVYILYCMLIKHVV